MLAEPALAEPDIDFARAYTRTEFERPGRPRLHRMLAAILDEELSVVSWGRRVLAEHTGTLRQSLESGGPANHLWVSHGLVMPFLYLGVVEQLPAEGWTVERAAQLGPYGYAEGFHLRVALGERASAS